MLEADRRLLIADADIAARHLVEDHPQVGRRGDRAVDAVDADRVDEVVLRAPLDEVVHRAVDAQAGAAEVDAVFVGHVDVVFDVRIGVEPAGVELRAAADVDAEIALLGGDFETVVPRDGHVEIAADLVAVGSAV